MYLNCHSYHSLRYGTIPVDELVLQAASCGVKAMALTDINTVTGIYDFIKACEAVKIKPLVGIEFRNDNEFRYIGLAKNREGLGEMCRFLTKHNFDGTSLPVEAPDFKNVLIVYSFDSFPENLKKNEYIGIRPEQLTRLYSEKKRVVDKMVVWQPVTYRTSEEFMLHKVLRAIDLNTILSKLQPTDHCCQSELMIDETVLLEQYREYESIVNNTLNIVRQCNFKYDFNSPKNRKHYLGNAQQDIALLTKLAYDGLRWRYGDNHPAAKARIEKELKVISDMNFCAYFLINWDIVQYSNSRGFMHIGRGSGANSIVSYCLGITDICPLELDLYFERFLNASRKVPPDFDIDWSWKERDEILRYIFDRFGREHVAFTGTIAEFKYRSIFREVGKVFGLPKHELDVLATTNMDSHDRNEVVRQVHKYGKMLEKYPNQRSMHSCGILISHEPITNYTALEMPPKGFPIVQFDMHIAENIGFEKFDILSQRGLGHIDDSVKLIEKNQGVRVDIRNILMSKDEPKSNEYLSIGKTIGCFYIESPAMRGLLRRLKCDNYLTLVAASSIIRPGVAQSGMMREYIFRHNNPGKFEYFHDVFKEQLGETYGIMVYQEDVIKIALHFAGMEAVHGDVLRRAMSGKGRSKAALQKVKDRYFECCAEKGHPLELSQEIYRQIESFAGYSFCKAHSASYAVESYQSLYLKVYYTVEFMAAVINNQGGFYRTEVYVHEAKMSGAVVNNPCVNRSLVETTVYGIDIYLGFMHLQGLESVISHEIVEERERHGDYVSLEDFINRVSIGIESIQILIFIGAFRFTGKTKNELVLAARLLLTNFKPDNRQAMLLQEPAKEFTFPKLERSVFEDAFDEIELLSFPVSCSPFDLLVTKYRGDVYAKDLLAHHKKQVRMLAYLISRKHVPTKRGEMFFGTWIDANGEYFDTAHFPDCLEKFPFQGGGCYLLLGIVEVDFHFPTITVTKMAKMPFIPDPRYVSASKKAVLEGEVKNQFKLEEEQNLQYRVYHNIKEDVSWTHRDPYPQEHEIGLPRFKTDAKPQ